MKARTRVAASLLIFAALPLVLVTWWGLDDRQRAEAGRSDQVLLGNASELAALLAAERLRWIESVRADAQMPGLEGLLGGDLPADPLRINRFFVAVGSRDTLNISAIGLLDLEGRVVQDSRLANHGRDESGEPWVQRTLATGRPQMIGPYTPSGESDAGLYVAAPVRDANEQRRGLLRLHLKHGLLGQIMAQGLIGNPGFSATLIDEQGEALFGVGPMGDAPIRLPAPTGGDGARTLDLGTERVALAAVADSPWRVAVRQPLTEWSAPQQALLHQWMFETVLLLALLLGASLWLGARIAAPMVQLAAMARRMAEGDYRSGPRLPTTEEARNLGESLDELAARLRENAETLAEEFDQRRLIEAALTQSREMYANLVEQLPGAVYHCANRPGWPMSYFSPQIEKICGYTAEELLVGDGDAFARLIPEEDSAAISRFMATWPDEDRVFDLRYRIRHRDGRTRWIWELGSLHRDPERPGARITGLLFDDTERQTASQTMNLLQASVDPRVGGDFFVALAHGLVGVLDADAVLIGRLRGEPPDRVESLAFALRDGRNDHCEYPLAGTPCAVALENGQLAVLEDVQIRFPDDRDLVSLGLHAYVGLRIDDRHGRPIGVIAVLHRQPLREASAITRMLEVFKARVAAELERAMAEEGLQRLAATLDQRVAERTQELEETNATLSRAMDHLVQREKLAALGSLVAGIAHELNTPIGNALLAATALNEHHRQVAELVEGGKLLRSTLDRFLAEGGETTDLIERNLRRAAALIQNFKRLAVDQASLRRRRFDLAEAVNDTLSSMGPRLQRQPHEVRVDIPPGLLLDSYPGPVEQVLTNLIENSLVHAFAPGQVGHIRISAEAVDGHVRLRYEDDGCGIPAELRQRVFDPFFTTRMGQGGSGLGLYVAYNLVHAQLGGNLRLMDNAPKGACFIVDLPIQAPAVPEESAGL